MEEISVGMCVLGLYSTGYQFKGDSLTKLVAIGCFCAVSVFLRLLN